jgi:hypothetical protein
MMKPLVLAVALTVIAGFAYWLEYSKKPKEAALEADAKKVFTLKGRAISLFEIRGASTKPENKDKLPLDVSLSCLSLEQKLCKSEDASKWDLVSPLKTKADDSTVSSLLKNFSNLTSSDVIDLSNETPEKRASLLKDYGLDSSARENPRIRRISFSFSGEEPITAYFGEKHPIGDGIFTLLVTGKTPNENRIFVVPEWQLSVFDQKTSYFRDKHLFGFNEKDVQSFKLLKSKKVNGALEAIRDADGKGWSLKFGGKEVAGDPATLDAVLSGIAHLSAKDMIAERQGDPAAKSALKGANSVYDIALKIGADTKRLRLYEKRKDAKSPASVYAVVEGQDPLYEIDSTEPDKLEKTLPDMRIGKLLDVTERYAITSIKFEGRGAEKYENVALKDSGGKWSIGSTETARGKIEELLDRLSSKVIIAYNAPRPSSTTLEKEIRITFRKTDDSKTPPIADLEFWSTQGRLFVKNRLTPKSSPLELVSDFAKSLPWESKTLFDAKKTSHP